MNSLRRCKPVTLGTLLLMAALMGHAQAASDQDTAQWRPQISEKLIRLPPNMMNNALERDYADSGLAMAISDVGAQVGLKRQTLTDLKQAVQKADGDLKVEMQHQYLAEKRQFVTLMQQHLDLRKKRQQIKLDTYQRLMQQLRTAKESTPKEVTELQTKQENLQKRFERSVSKVDMKIFGTPDGESMPSRYNTVYQANQQAMHKLLAALEAHPMNRELDNHALEPESKQDFLRNLMVESEKEMALVSQERTILGYMAKMVALDALSLSEKVQDPDLLDSDVPADAQITTSVDLFVSDEK
ncbi:hypothetical protein Mmc1_0182 [Magnetococcus marinus MC-1]|uniref:Uncharacterized protein n=1 Tax=Magnetococcus marinus (strain ATCC BAA-1437 / JCM 17883 / MC-1) TaxID=156889 RepID=A0L416_MAGMM|nr:hypothetical protein [Magnetococcus marinus]ABK42709.1 hypothetical protein Mmc1_0182 [Magnetococcus marinus MC-1]